MFDPFRSSADPHQFLALGLLLLGVGLAVTGVSVYLESTASACGGCVRFHPLFVVPVGAAAMLTTAGGWLLGRA